jgi:hypothetical protein
MSEGDVVSDVEDEGEEDASAELPERLHRRGRDESAKPRLARPGPGPAPCGDHTPVPQRPRLVFYDHVHLAVVASTLLD